MEPFNIKIKVGINEVTITILPTEFGYYKVIYFGGILGSISKEALGNWIEVPESEVEASDLPPYHHELKLGEVEVEFTPENIKKIGDQIDAEVN